MRPVSAAFLDLLRGSHGLAVTARVVAPGQTGVDPDGIDLPILDGDVQLDADADIRSTIDLTVPGDLWPRTGTDTLAPYGTEVFVQRGVTYGNGQREMVSLGYHRIDSLEQGEAPRGTIRITGSDRMAGLVEGRLYRPTQYQPGVTLGAIFDELVHDIYPWATIEWDDDSDQAELARNLVAEDDRYAFLHDLVTSVGKVWWWDHRGVLRIADPPDPSTSVWDVNHGAGGVLVSMSRQLSRTGVYNGIVATGEATDTLPPVRAVLGDNNPTSPTRWGGPFGKVPRFYSSPFLTTVDQCISAARSILSATLGVPYSVDFGAIPNPALEPLDPVTVTYALGRPPETHIVQTLTIPLTADQAMTAKTREMTLVDIGEVS